ncbi:RHS repeat-associated core domain-containing protein [Pseudomonas sp. NEEL19]|uniref:RHS repeat-associated core domain-containing protein n=1 Tax=Pseudomonas sp. NEEL19 TaxID=2867409 RepID=UPI002367D505|nr:RHS repeat-associated core domain-containing protein [Pseudomonas sp. NEEL19]WDM60106.1 RHS repeat-associated core domain-containing protein [Pseudomonas sp. NEEL19]
MASKLFYQQERLALIQDAQVQRRLMTSVIQIHAVLVETMQATPNVLLASDALHSTLLISPQQKAKPYCYSPYGHQPNHPGLPAFTGQVPEPIMGGYLLGNGYRLYSPLLMRFHSPDNWSPFGAAGINPYVYCDSDPVNHSDPSGHIKILKAVKNAALKVFDTVAYEYVKAKYGKKIFKKIDQLNAAPSARPSADASVPTSNLNLAEIKVGGRMLNDEIKHLEKNQKTLSKHLEGAERGEEGSPVIFGEPSSYIADILANQKVKELNSIGRLEKAVANLREHKRAVSYQTHIHARLG